MYLVCSLSLSWFSLLKANLLALISSVLCSRSSPSRGRNWCYLLKCWSCDGYKILGWELLPFSILQIAFHYLQVSAVANISFWSAIPFKITFSFFAWLLSKCLSCFFVASPWYIYIGIDLFILICTCWASWSHALVSGYLALIKHLIQIASLLPHFLFLWDSKRMCICVCIF